MEAINLIASILLAFFGFSLLIGLFYRPWVVLWWMEKQNRIRVILYYGIPFLILFFIKILTN